MKALLLLIAVLGCVVADFRPDCTAEQMKGLNVVGYAYDRVFRITDYPYKIQLDTESMLEVVKSSSNVMLRDLTRLVHLHQGFDHKLVVLEYGESATEETINPEFWKLSHVIWYHNISDLAVINSTSVGLKERIDSYPSGWDSFNFETTHPDNTDFSSFVYDDLLYHQGGYTDISVFDGYYDDFVANSSLCVGMKFPVVDIAYKPPICHNRVLNEPAPTPTDPDDDDEWIVALVKGIRTTRSEKLCRQSNDPEAQTNVEYDKGWLILPNHDVFSYYMLKPGMDKPCMFAQGNKYLFHDVQVEPADPILFATGQPSSTIMPPTTDPATRNGVEGSDGKNTGETQAPSWLFYFGFVFSIAASLST